MGDDSKEPAKPVDLDERRRKKRVEFPTAGVPDTRSLSPEEELVQQQGERALAAMQVNLNRSLEHLARRKLRVGALAVALGKDGLYGKKCPAVAVAALVGMCPEPQRKQPLTRVQLKAAQDVTDLRKKVNRHYHCRPGHENCQSPCALDRGRLLLSGLRLRASRTLSKAQLDLARDTDPR